MSPPRPYRLPNGLRVVVARDRWVPLVSILVRYDVGSVHDPRGLRGLAHLVEHLSFASGAHLDEGNLWPHFYRIGAVGVNASTAPWHTDYVETVPAVELETALWLESERMGFFQNPNPARLADEIDVVLAEKHWHHADEGDRIRYPLYQAIFPAPHPYARIPPSDEIANATVKDLADFVAAYMGPGNATLVLVGDVPDDVDALIKRYFSDLEGGSAPPDPPYLDVAPTSERRIRGPAVAGSGPEVWVAWRLPRDLPERDLASMSVLLTSIDNPNTDQLESLHGATIAGRYRSEAVLLAARLIDDDVDSALEVIGATLQRIQQDGLSPDDLTRAKRRCLAGHLESLETYEGRASRLAYRLRRDGTGDLDTWGRKLQAVQSADVQTLAARTFGPRRVVMTSGVPQ